MLLRARAFAQIDPDDTGEGIRVGLAAQHHSGQVGTVDLLQHGSEGTLVVVRVFSAPRDRSERARIARARSCEAAEARAEVELAPVRAGSSRTIIPMQTNSLLARRAIVEVFAPSRRGLQRVSCGELRR